MIQGNLSIKHRKMFGQQIHKTMQYNCYISGVRKKQHYTSLSKKPDLWLRKQKKKEKDWKKRNKRKYRYVLFLKSMNSVTQNVIDVHTSIADVFDPVRVVACLLCLS